MNKKVIPLAMRRNCNLDLCLLPPASFSAGVRDGNGDVADSTSRTGQDESIENPEQLTILYDGRISVCNATERQARSILDLARRETEERMGTPSSGPATPLTFPPGSQILHSPIPVLTPTPTPTSTPNANSMKRSLQRFLQKRKNRNQATSPYTR